jgi:hypothetical protein
MTRAYRSLTWAVAALLLTACAAMAAQENAAPREWQSLDVVGLTALANELWTRGDTAKAECERLASYVVQRYTADTAAGQGNLEQWLDLQAVLGAEFPAEIRTVMAGNITKNMVPGSPVDVGLLQSDRVVRIGSALASLGQGPQACVLCSTWVNGSEKYKGGSVDVLLKIASLVGAQDKEAAAARQRLAAHVLGKFLGDPETVRTVDCSQWKGFARCLGKEVTDEKACALWRDKLYEAFAESKVLPSLKGEEVQDLENALYVLGDKESHRVVPAWMATGTAAWQSLPPSRLVFLAQQLSYCKESELPQKARLADFILTRYVATTEAIREVAPWEWRAFARHLAKEVKEESRRTWAERLRVAFGDAESLGKLNPDGILNLVTALERLGDKDTSKVLAAWASSDAAWRSLQPEHLQSFAKELVKGGETTKALRLRLADQVTKTYVATPEAAQKVACGTWKNLAGALGSGLDGATRRAWVDGIVSAHAGSPEALKTLKTGGTCDLLDALAALGETAGALSVVERALAARPWTGSDLAQLAGTLSKLGEGGRAGRQRLLEHVSSQCLANGTAAKSLSCSDWAQLVRNLGGDLTKEQRAVWRDGLRASFVADAQTLRSLNRADVTSLANALRQLGDQQSSTVVAAWILRR